MLLCVCNCLILVDMSVTTRLIEVIWRERRSREMCTILDKMFTNEKYNLSNTFCKWWLNFQMLHFVPPIRLSSSVHFVMKILTSIVKCRLIHPQGLYYYNHLHLCICIDFSKAHKCVIAHINKLRQKWSSYAIIIRHCVCVCVGFLW